MVSILPQPVRLENLKGNFSLNKDTRIVVVDDNLRNEGIYLAAHIEKRSGHRLPVISNDVAGNHDGTIYLRQDDSLTSESDEAYRLDIKENGITIRGKSASGVFYGIQTLRQIFRVEYEDPEKEETVSWILPCLEIEDYPRYRWRGMMLDVSRHFFSKDSVKAFIDYLAMYKLNTFHWHLVDDQGWRMEIKKYPKLTEIGAWRVDREHLPWREREPQKPGEEATYGGYYTQEDIREVVAYAESRHITIVPEIEMPAHIVSALAAYPQYSCTGGPFTVLPGGYWPISDIYCAGNDETFHFLQDILTEVMALFPGEFIHIGGDEAEKSNWQKCPKCQTRIKEENLADENELQSYFIKRIEAFVNSKGRKLIGWDEILEGGLAPRATVMSWRGFEGGVTAARSGHDVVMTPTSHCYFDYYQGNKDHEPLAIGGFLPIKKVYEFDPVPDELQAEESSHILGGQANLWTEFVPDFSHLQYMIFPRLSAMAEVLWSQKETRNWIRFSSKVEREMDRYDALGIHYADSSIRVEFDVETDPENNRVLVAMTCELSHLDIRYTLDGSRPGRSSPRYSEPVVLEKNTIIHAAVFRDGARIGPVLTKSLDLHDESGE